MPNAERGVRNTEFKSQVNLHKNPVAAARETATFFVGGRCEGGAGCPFTAATEQARTSSSAAKIVLTTEHKGSVILPAKMFAN